MIDESRAVGRGFTGDPFQHISASGVVVGQGVGHRIICFFVTLQQFFQIPCPRQRIGDGIETLRVLESADMFGIGPLLGRLFAKLHQADLSYPSACAWIEAAFPPNDRSDERRFHAVTVRSNPYGPILAMLQPALP